MIYEIKDLSFSYPGSLRKVFSGVNLSIDDGEILTVLGRNGAGKSTLFSCMLGLFPSYEGSIKLCGKEIKEAKEKEIASEVGFVPQTHIPTFGFKVIDFVTLGCASKMGLFQHPGKEEESLAMEALSTMGLIDFAQRNYAELSGGERQLVTIARALVSKPRLILFDEPTAHLDYSNQVKTLRVIKGLSEKGYTVAVTTHDPNHALLLGGNVAIFHEDGSVQKGSVDELIEEENLKNIYGSDIKIRYLEEFKRKVCIYPKL